MWTIPARAEGSLFGEFEVTTEKNLENQVKRNKRERNKQTLTKHFQTAMDNECITSRGTCGFPTKSIRRIFRESWSFPFVIKETYTKEARKFILGVQDKYRFLRCWALLLRTWMQTIRVCLEANRKWTGMNLRTLRRTEHETIYFRHLQWLPSCHVTSLLMSWTRLPRQSAPVTMMAND